jgi:hypothetical protein
MADGDSDDRNSRAMIQFARAQAAMMNGDWGEARLICARELGVGGLDQGHEASGRMAYCEALIQTALRQSSTPEKKRDLQLAIIEGRRVCELVKSLSWRAQNRSEAFQLLGTALMCHAALCRGDDRSAEANEAILQLEGALQLDPSNIKASEHLKNAREIRENSAPKAKSAGCFIATATCGCHSAPEVIALSAFRDEVLNVSWMGRTFIRIYYIFSPPAAAIIARSPGLRRLAMTLIVKPSVSIAQMFGGFERPRKRRVRKGG